MHAQDCSCFDCRIARREAAEKKAEDEALAKAAEQNRIAYIRRRGGEPHTPNSKLRSGR